MKAPSSRHQFLTHTTALAFSIFIMLLSGNAVDVWGQSDYPKVTTMLLSQDWTAVAGMLETVTPETPDPVLRLIKGHACLAINRNNESLCLFISASSNNNLKQWDTWTRVFAENHPGHPVAAYLRGDAMSRQQRYQEADALFSSVLDKYPNDWMILNARGVVNAIEGRLFKAKEDFTAAQQKQPGFADAYANLGARLIQMKDGADAAVKYFNAGIKYFPDFALALHGRGCIRSLFSPAEAQTDMANSIKNAACAVVVFAENELSIQAYMNGMEKQQMLAALTSKNPGTTFGVSYEKAAQAWNSYSNNPGQKTYNNFCNAANQLPPSQLNTLWENKMQPSFQSKPELLCRTQAYNDTVNIWNKNGAPVATAAINSAITGVGAGATAFVAGSGNIPAAVGTAAGTQGLASAVNAGLTARTTNNLNFSNDLGTRMTGYRCLNNVGGVNTSYAQATRDYGDWPFGPLYGLMYGKTPTNDWL